MSVLCCTFLLLSICSINIEWLKNLFYYHTKYEIYKCSIDILKHVTTLLFKQIGVNEQPCYWLADCLIKLVSTSQ